MIPHELRDESKSTLCNRLLRGRCRSLSQRASLGKHRAHPRKQRPAPRAGRAGAATRPSDIDPRPYPRHDRANPRKQRPAPRAGRAGAATRPSPAASLTGGPRPPTAPPLPAMHRTLDWMQHSGGSRDELRPAATGTESGERCAHSATLACEIQDTARTAFQGNGLLVQVPDCTYFSHTCSALA